MEHKNLAVHVVVFPLPFQGPMNSMLKLAELLCLSGLDITFVVTEHVYSRLLQSISIDSAFKKYAGFRLKTISDGLPEDHPRTGLKYAEVLDSMNLNTKRIFRDMLNSGSLSSETGRAPVTCVVADGLLGFTCDVSREIGIPIFYVRTLSPCCLWICICLPKLIESGEIPFQGDDMDELIRSVPGMETFLRRRDLPSFCRSPDLEDQHIKIFLPEINENPRADGLILNTFEELDESIISHIRTICPNIYTIGPFHSHLKYKTKLLTESTTSAQAATISLWQEDQSCLLWLDQQLPKSVIYISFGSITVLNKIQLLEFWHGVVDSGIKFLWVMRPDSVSDDGDWKSQIPEKLLKGTQERGRIVEWAPQQVVLSHQAIGGFLTHSGWNSTLESISAGVPMICWPFFTDQQINSRFVSEVWKLGLDMKDTCDRTVVGKMVRELMEVRKEEFAERAAAMAESARRCLREGGSSYHNLDRLIKDIVAKSGRWYENDTITVVTSHGKIK